MTDATGFLLQNGNITDGAYYVRAYRALLRDDRLSLAERAFFLLLRDRCTKYDGTWVNYPTLAKDAGVSRKTVGKYIQKLTATGHIETIERPFKAMIKRIRPIEDVYTWDELHADLPHGTPYEDTQTEPEEDPNISRRELFTPSSGTFYPTGGELFTPLRKKKEEKGKRRKKSLPDTASRHTETRLDQDQEAGQGITLELEQGETAAPVASASNQLDFSDRDDSENDFEDFLRGDGVSRGATSGRTFGKKAPQNDPAIERPNATGVLNAFARLACEKFSDFTPPKKWTGRELGNAKKLLEEYDFDDILMMLEMAVADWIGIRQNFAHIAKGKAVPHFVTIFTLRRELMPLATAGTGVTNNRHRVSTFSKKHSTQPESGWGDLFKDGG